MKDIYLKVENPTIKGESADKDHAEWIELSSFTHSIIQPKSATASTAGGHTSERVHHGDVVVVKEEDSASPVIAQYCSGGQTFDEITIEFYRADGEGNRVKYKEVKLKHAIISSITTQSNEQGMPTETISFKYAAIQWKYTKQKIGGNQAGNTQGAWSLTKNDKTYSV